ncbi:hypothetical protein ACHHYP_11378 [Achlya hypogyna]|uniref:Transposase Tc1-like domain-containing protein n=1 Tax=Achlya hypogyna TaxID=1202772 RepID=A0A1V9YJ76_ACHHY|nr:hypothetical protein ACHHYP_11378 [Achlya hypogyna]
MALPPPTQLRAQKKRTPADIERAIRLVPHVRRQTMRRLAAATSIPRTTLHRHKKYEPRLRAKSNWLKPRLTDDNMRARLAFTVSHLRPARSGVVLSFMCDTVHMDDK